MPTHSIERIAAMKAEGHGMRNLNDEAAHWQTPATDSFRSRGGDRKDEMGLDQQARLFLPQDQATAAGEQSSGTRRVLNPQFVEWLMGWPIGWTDCEPVETGLSLWLQHARGLLSTLCSPAPAKQPDLFG
jgi:hypothetical protein